MKISSNETSCIRRDGTKSHRFMTYFMGRCWIQWLQTQVVQCTGGSAALNDPWSRSWLNDEYTNLKKNGANSYYIRILYV